MTEAELAEKWKQVRERVQREKASVTVDESTSPSIRNLARIVVGNLLRE